MTVVLLESPEKRSVKSISKLDVSMASSKKKYLTLKNQALAPLSEIDIAEAKSKIAAEGKRDYIVEDFICIMYCKF